MLFNSNRLSVYIILETSKTKYIWIRYTITVQIKDTQKFQFENILNYLYLNYFLKLRIILDVK